jgi:hypothetical protein
MKQSATGDYGSSQNTDSKFGQEDHRSFSSLNLFAGALRAKSRPACGTAEAVP